MIHYYRKDMTAIEKEYRIVPLHKRPDLIPDCCTLLNSEWPRSETARYIIILNLNKVLFNN